jgi:hypothetical protein
MNVVLLQETVAAIAVQQRRMTFAGCFVADTKGGVSH